MLMAGKSPSDGLSSALLFAFAGGLPQWKKFGILSPTVEFTPEREAVERPIRAPASPWEASLQQ